MVVDEVYYRNCEERKFQVYNASNPFDFMENLSIEAKTNFFERRVSEYQRAGVLSREEEKQFNLEANF